MRERNDQHVARATGRLNWLVFTSYWDFVMFSYILLCYSVIVICIGTNLFAYFIWWSTRRRLPAAFARTSHTDRQRAHESEKRSRSLPFEEEEKRDCVFCLSCCLFCERKKRRWWRHSSRVLGFHCECDAKNTDRKFTGANFRAAHTVTIEPFVLRMNESVLSAVWWLCNPIWHVLFEQK